MDQKCPECEFLKNSAEKTSELRKDLLILENDHFSAYYSTKPVIQGHIVVLPKKHHFRMIEFSAEEWKDFGELIGTLGVAGSLRGFHMLTPSGIEYGKHLVVYILPVGREKFSYSWESKEGLKVEDLKNLKLRINEIQQNMPIKGRAIELDPNVSRNSEVQFEDIMPGMPCLLHGTRHNCEYAPPKDAIPPIYQPVFVKTEEVDFLKPDDFVASVTINDEVRAYPICILDYHEIVNDVIDDVHFAVSYCPLCASSLVFNRQISSSTSPTRFGVSGFLYQSDLLMFDHETESLWSQIEGKCIYGKHEGQDLDLIPFKLSLWKKWKQAHPNGKVLSIETGYYRDYSHFPYGEYTVSEGTIFPTKKKDEKNRLHPKTIVYGIESDGVAKVYPEDYILDQKIIQDTIGNTPILITIDQADGVVALIPRVDGTQLSLERRDSGLIDKETGTKWTFQGEGIEGTYVGKQLQCRPDLLRMYYFAFVAFNPHLEVEIYQNIHEKPGWKERLFRKFKK